MRYLLTLFCMSMTFSGFAQKKAEVNIELTGTPKGVYLKMNQPAETGYRIFRKEKGGDYETIGVYNRVSTVADLERRMKTFGKFLPHLGSPNKALVDTIWNRYLEDKSMLVDVPLPLMQLSVGTAFLDTSAVLGNTYQYKIVFSYSDRTVESEPSAYQLHQPEFSKLELFDVKNVGRSARLEWSAPAIEVPPYFEVYRRQAAGKGDFEKINIEKGTRTTEFEDTTVFIVVDTTGTVGITYDYYLGPMDLLGNEGNHSDTIRLELGGRQNVAAVHNFRTRSDSLGIRLSWRALVPNPSINNILVTRSENYDTGYALLTVLPTTETKFIDRDVEGGKLYYYQLIVQGAANYSLPTPRVSGKFTGRIKLPSPYHLESNSLKEGVELSWKYRDTGRVKGFKVFRSDHPRQGFEFVGEMVEVPKDTNVIRFIDSTAITENKTYYYSVAAVSRTSNLGTSSLVVRARPAKSSKILVPTGLRSLWLNDSVVSISWTDMERQNTDISGYHIYRNATEIEEVSDEHLIDSLDMNEFVDTLAPGESRWYWVKSHGTNGELSHVSAPIRVQADVDRPLPPFVNISQQNKKATLFWEGALHHNIQEYHIYRAVGENETALIGKVPANQDAMAYVDEDTQSGELYFYYVTSVDRHGVESEHSKEVHIRF